MSLARLAEEFVSRANACHADDQLGALLCDVCRALGFACHALVNNHYFMGRPTGFGLISYPAIWHDVFLARELFRIDPVLIACARTGLPFDWIDLTKLVPVDGIQRQILEAGAREGLAYGFTVPVNVPGEPAFSCSFVHRRACPLGFDRRQCAWVIGSTAIDVARRLRGYPAAAVAAPHLSPRERDCLRWIAAGKADPEIATILGVGLPTVRTYVVALRRKFDVVSRSQLPARAIRFGIMGFDEAIPHG